MQNEKILLTRVKRLLERQNALLYRDKTVMEAEYSLSEEALQAISIGEMWGQPWQTAEFRIRGTIPETLAGKHYGLYFDCDGEACVMDAGTPIQGLTPKVDWYHKAAKHFFPLHASVDPGSYVSLEIQASANDLFGAGKDEYRLRECALVSFDESLFQDLMDIGLLLNLAEALPEGTVRRQRILRGLDRVCDLWNSDLPEARAILKELLSHQANSSALTAYSVGHAHLDLAWLWPIRETRRKGGRTFANALRLLEQYPDYVFGASQAQLYQWIKQDYPALYEQVKTLVRSGRWEVQGASWVEFDTNLISSESIIRQFLYGKRFFESEFGSSPEILWLPDCFGFSGNLPQFLRGCEVPHFMTQKLSWNETNTFPHHLFAWEGIDGTRILAHQLPTNDYNFSNDPSAFLETEKRYAQSGVCACFLNLYGIGDGGGGPTRNHIEYGLRLQDLEGVCKFRFAKGAEFFARAEEVEKELLPVAYGELYLEFHRGTYTTQARMKQDNRNSEKLLSASEFMAVLAGQKSYPAALRKVWEDTLLLQFHDIIPGSSIGMVYEEAHALSARNHMLLKDFIGEQADIFLRDGKLAGKGSHAIFNPCNQALEEWHAFPTELKGLVPIDVLGEELPCLETENSLLVKLSVPAWSFGEIQFTAAGYRPKAQAKPASLTLENLHLIVQITKTGGIASIRDTESGVEYLAAESNRLLLWEDEPNNWGAWDINHFYRSTKPQIPDQVEFIPELSISLDGEFSRVVQDITLGNSTLRQTIELRYGEGLIRISHEVDWREKHKMLRAHFYPDVHFGTATYGIQGGVIKRSAKPKNAWEAAQFEVPAQRFADLSQPDRGCAILCDVKYGYRCVDNELEINLLRSPADVDPGADIHTHSYRYAIHPHAGDYEHSDVFQMAEKNAHELLIAPAHKVLGDLPQPLFKLNAESVNLDTVKPAEEGSGTVLRLHEFKGQSGTAQLFSIRPHSRVWECNMLEKPLTLVKTGIADNDPLYLEFRPFEIKTILLEDEQ
ncbi:MAG: hypothetical protein K0B87_02150 [Candidatus Syntrophosphaera sp.]|nr:hypothetical protein [Candidatus Syntrophosphaera sp.]